MSLFMCLNNFVIKGKLILVLFVFFNILFGVKAYEISNSAYKDLDNVVIKISLSEAKLLKVLDENGNILDFCYYHEDTNFCNNQTSNIIYVKIPNLPANSKLRILLVESSQNYAKDGSSVFIEYYDFRNYIPENMRYNSIDSEGGYCFNNGVDYYLRIGNLSLDNDYYIFKFNMRGYSSVYTSSAIYLRNINNYNNYYYLFYIYGSYPYYETGTVAISRTKQIYNYSNRYYTRTYTLNTDRNYHFELRTYSSYSRGFCLRSIFFFKNYSSLSVREILPANFQYTFNPTCYLARDKIIFKQIQCENLPLILSSQDSIFIYNKQDDMWMEIKDFGYNITSFPNIKIVMNKLDEGVGYVRFVAAIENASFSKAYVKVPITSDVNKQLINVTKNGLPYYINKYYLVFEFNESDPIFEAFFPIENKKEEKGFFSKLFGFIKSLIN